MDGVDSIRYERLARFLDGLDRADPRSLDEPYRSLWFRIKDLDPRSVRNVPLETPVSSPTAADVSEFTIEESEPVEVATTPGRERRIEVISPSQVGPTYEMRVETKPKVTFKAAAEGEVETVRRKEGAAKNLLQVQEALVPLKGVQGDALNLFAMNKDLAKHYREGDYPEVERISGVIIATLASKEFRQSMMVHLQKKMKEYEEVGIEMGPARERFKQLAVSYKEDRADFKSLAGACNKLAEDAAKAVLGDPEEGEVIVAEIVKGPVDPVLAPVISRVRKDVKPAQVGPDTSATTPSIPAPGPAQDLETTKPGPVMVVQDAPVKGTPASAQGPAQGSHAAPAVTPEPDLKPLIRIVKKKLVAIDEEEERPPETTDGTEGPAAPTPSSPSDQASNAPLMEKQPPVVEVKPVVPATAAETPVTKKKVQEVKSTEADDLQEAYKRITSVYNAAAKMHASGKDVRQLFDLYNFAEEARKKGDNKIYIGVSKQLESMLISMQTKK